MNRLATLVLGLIAIAGTAAAKDLAGVYEDATHSDPVIRQADANRLAAREARPQAWAAVMPQIVGTASVLRDHSSGYQDTISEIPNPADPNTPLLQPLPLPSTIDTTTRGWAVNLRSNLFSWTNWMQIKAASAEVAQAEANYKAAEQDLILRVATAYFLVLSAEANVEANTAALEAITHQLDQANKRFEVGLIAITDVQDAKAGHDNAAAAVIQAKRLLATAQYRLQEITGQQYDRLSRPGTDLPLKGPEPVDESAWVDISLAQNMSLISSRLAADIARDNVRAAVGGHLPTLDLVAGRSYTKGESTQTLDYLPPFNNVDNKFNDHQIGLQFTLPIFSGGFTQSKVRENEYRWMAAKEAVVQSSRATERQARDAYLGVISGIARVQALRQARESSQTALKATEAGYDVGTRTSVDVLTARRVLVQAETDYANSKYDYIVSVLQLREAAGTLDRAQLLEVNAWLTVDAPTAPANATPQNVLPDVAAPQPTTPPPNPPATAPQGGGTR